MVLLRVVSRAIRRAARSCQDLLAALSDGALQRSQAPPEQATWGESVKLGDEEPWTELHLDWPRERWQKAMRDTFGVDYVPTGESGSDPLAQSLGQGMAGTSEPPARLPLAAPGTPPMDRLRIFITREDFR